MWTSIIDIAWSLLPHLTHPNPIYQPMAYYPVLISTGIVLSAVGPAVVPITWLSTWYYGTTTVLSLFQLSNVCYHWYY